MTTTNQYDALERLTQVAESGERHAVYANPIIISSVMAQFFAGDDTYNFDTVAGEPAVVRPVFPGDDLQSAVQGL